MGRNEGKVGEGRSAMAVGRSAPSGIGGNERDEPCGSDDQWLVIGGTSTVIVAPWTPGTVSV